MSDRATISLNVPSTGDVDGTLTDTLAAMLDLAEALGAPPGSLKAMGGLSLRCDGCDSRLPAESMADGLANAARLGWSHHDDGTDYCPACTRKADR